MVARRSKGCTPQVRSWAFTTTSTRRRRQCYEHALSVGSPGRMQQRPCRAISDFGSRSLETPRAVIGPGRERNVEFWMARPRNRDLVVARSGASVLLASPLLELNWSMDD